MKALFLLFSLISYVTAGQVIQNCVTNSKSILLTFDDGPDIITSQVVSLLNSNNIKGMFFVNGIKVMSNSANVAQIKAMYDKGHIIGTHTFSHAALTGLNDFNVRRELYDNEFYVFRRLFKKRPYYIRPPYFDYDDRITGLFDEFGYVNVVASFESTDWYSPEDPTRTLNTCKAKIDAGAKDLIVLLHENIASNYSVLQQFITYALSKGYKFIDPNTCIGLTTKYSEDNYYGPNLLNGFTF